MEVDIGFERHRHLFDGKVVNIHHHEDQASSSSKVNQATATGSSDKPAVFELSSGEDEDEPEAASTSSPKRKRKRNKPKQSKETINSLPVMTTRKAQLKPTPIFPTDPSKKQFPEPAVTSSSTRSSTNDGTARSAYKDSKIKTPFGPVDRGFDSSRPGDTSSSSLNDNSRAGQRPQTHLPSFMKKQQVASHAPQSTSPWNTEKPAGNLEKENRSGRQSNREQGPLGAQGSVLNAQGTSMRFPPGASSKPGLKIIGAAIHNPSKQASLNVAGAALRRQNEETQRATRSSSVSCNTHGGGINLDCDFIGLGKESNPAPSGDRTSRTDQKGKGKEKSKVIDIDDSEDSDTIENPDSDSDSPKVSTSRAAHINTSSNRANGTSSIPPGITAQRKETYEKGGGNTIHARPPQAAGNTSPDSFLLHSTTGRKGEKKSDKIGNMKSKDSARPKTIATSTSIAGRYVLPLSKVLTEHGEYKAKGNRFELFVSTRPENPYFGIGGQCSKPMNDNAPNLEGIIINPNHIAGITLPTDVTSTMTNVFIEIWPDGELSESTDPKSGFYFFEVNGQKNEWNQGRLAAEISHVKKFAKKLKTLDRISALEHVSSSGFETLRQRYTMSSKTLPLRVQSSGRETLAPGKHGSRPAMTGQRKRIQDELMQPRQQPQHNHEISDVEGEDEAAVVVQPIKARPRAIPSAGVKSTANPPPWDVERPRKGPSTSSATNGSTSVSTSDSEMDAKAPRRKSEGIAPTNFFSDAVPAPSKIIKSKGKARGSAHNTERDSSSPEYLPEASKKGRNLPPRKSKTRADGNISKGVISDSDSEAHPDPKLWEGRLMPEEETALVFPREGTGAVTVINSDINRLAPGEFLNDTLIEYGMKRIWQRIRDMDPVLGDQIHMFSSFFYKKLSPDQKKTDAYQTVRKWTNKVNLFEKKYIFVPINEYFHWYLAVIVNPARILRPAPPKRSKPPPAKRATRASQESIVEAADSAKVTTSRFFNTPAGSTGSQQNVQEETNDKAIGGEKTVIMDSDAAEDLSEPELPASDKSRSNSPFKMDVDEGANPDGGRAPASTSKQSSKTQNPNSDAVTEAEPIAEQGDNAVSNLLHDQVQSLSIATGEQDISYQNDDERCYIFTLDSLHSKHTSVINTLKKYLISEAKDKGRIPAETTVPTADGDGVFKGVAASVPLQPNMSDCGLYVLHFTDVFLQNVKELLPLLTNQGKCSGEVTNKRWHYEKAATKREAFYKELLEESKEWKEWRNRQIAAKASEPEEEASTEDDDEGEDLELVQRQQPTPDSKVVKKGKLRRHSDADEMSEEGHYVPPHRASTPLASRSDQQAEHSTPKEKGREFIGVEIPSPERQRSRANARQSPAIEYDMALDNSPEPEDTHATSTPKASMNLQAFTADVGAKGTIALDTSVMDAIRTKVQDAETSMTPHSVIKGEIPTASEIGLHQVAHGDASQGTGSLMRGVVTDDTSGEEDSSEEVTDDDKEEPQVRPSTSRRRRSSAQSGPDAQDDSFRAEMILPVGSSQGPRPAQEAPTPGHDLDLVDDDKPLEANLELYSRKPARLTPTPPPSVDRDLEMEIKATLAGKPSGRKRPLSSGSQPSSSPSKPDSRPAVKRPRQHSKDSTPPNQQYNARRRIPQDDDDEDDGTSATRTKFQANHMSSAQKSAASFQNQDNSILISDSEDELSAASPVPVIRDSSGLQEKNPQPAFPSQPVVSSSSQNTMIKEKLGRPPSRK